MAKADKGAVKVVLKCIYSGLEHTPGPGDVLETDAEEAARLIEVGAADAWRATEAPAAE